MTHHSNMKPNSKKRGYLLPKGSKDLIDVLKPKVAHPQQSSVRTICVPPIIGEMVVPVQMTVGQLADALKQKPSKIIADVEMLFDESVSKHAMLNPNHIMQLVRLYGYTAKIAA